MLSHYPMQGPVAAGGPGPIDIGINFRQTQEYGGAPERVNEVFCSHSTFIYPSTVSPVSGDSVTAGWVTTPVASANRDVTIDPNLMGIIYSLGGDDIVWRFDLTGSVRLHWAAGDRGGARDVQLQVFDGSTGGVAVFDNKISTVANEWWIPDLSIADNAEWVATGNAVYFEHIYSNFISVRISDSAVYSISHLRVVTI